jgi:hypothetical protein
MHRIKRHSRDLAVVLGVIALVAIPRGRPASATEPMGDLGVSLRLVEAVPGNRAAGPAMTGVARIEVLVEAFRPTREIQMSVVRPDGSSWSRNKGSFTTGELDWSDPSGAPVRLGSRGPSVPSRGAIRTTITVPLSGAGMHEIGVTVTGLSGGKPIATEGMVRVGMGVPENELDDDGKYANFPLKEVK